jgi:hypothetical protein
MNYQQQQERKATVFYLPNKKNHLQKMSLSVNFHITKIKLL